MSDTGKKLFLLAILTIFSQNSFADSSYRSFLGVDVKGIKLNMQNGVGWLAGIHHGYYLGTSNTRVGWAVNYGTPTGDSPANENVLFGGLTLGYDGRLNKYFIFDIGILAGYGMGRITRLNQEQTSYYVIEPSAGIGVALGGGCRLKLEVGYTYMTNVANFSGTTFGFRIDFRSATQSKDIND